MKKYIDEMGYARFSLGVLGIITGVLTLIANLMSESDSALLLSCPYVVISGSFAFLTREKYVGTLLAIMMVGIGSMAFINYSIFTLAYVGHALMVLVGTLFVFDFMMAKASNGYSRRYGRKLKPK